LDFIARRDRKVTSLGNKDGVWELGAKNGTLELKILSYYFYACIWEYGGIIFRHFQCVSLICVVYTFLNEADVKSNSKALLQVLI
jgi:hypothetical protein